MQTTLTEAIERFLQLKKASGKAEGTRVWYARILGLMAKQLGENKTLGDISQDSLIDYLAHLRDTHKPSGADSYTRAIKSFWTWSSKRYSVQDPSSEVKYPKVKPSYAMAMKEADFRLLFDKAGIREKAILAMLLATGARASEILQLKYSQVEWDNRRARVLGKGSKFRFLHWDELTDDYLYHYCKVRSTANDALFNLSYNGLYLALKRLAKSVGLEGRFNPHSIRHLFGKLKTASGENAILLAKLMGHSDVNMTLKTYSQFEPPELALLDDKKSTVKKILE